MILFAKILLILVFVYYLFFEISTKIETKGDTLARTLLCLSIINLSSIVFLIL